MVEIIPAVLTDSSEELHELLDLASGKVLRVQIDIIDGKYTKNRTIDPEVLKKGDSNLKLDFQLMVDEPINWIKKCVHAGADRIIGHIEMMEDQEEFIEKLQEEQVSGGLGIDLKTPLTKIEFGVLGKIEIVLVMSVTAGFGGQEFDPSSLSKIRELDKMRREGAFDYVICVDGGVNENNIIEIVNAGTDEIVIGRRLFKGDIKENLRKLREQIK